jgi:GNAT acetyltransferase-like protein
MTTLEVVRLAGRPNEWDRDIQEFSTKTLFHESAWLNFVQTMHPRGQLEYFEIRQGGAAAGFFCAVQVNKAMSFKVYGSPLPEAGMYMGPLVSGGVAQAELVEALVRLCRSNRIACLEMANDWLDPELMRRLGFRVSPSVTHVCPLAQDEASAWAALRGNCRTRIRKAQKSGLEAEITDDAAIVDDFYRYITLVLQAKGRSPQYGIERPRSLMACLTPADRLFSVRVKYQGRVIGAAFYPHDERSMYYWDGASDLAHLELCPNELLHWTAMKEAIRRGIPQFNIGGGPAPSRFTQKFGGGEVPYHSYRRNFIPFLETARNLYHLLDFKRSAKAPHKISA